MAKLFIISIFLLNLYGCSQKTTELISNSPLCRDKNITLVINQHILNTQVACSNKDRAIGLMNLTSLAEDSGMIFFFADNNIHVFWMKDTLIPLSIAFVDSNWKIIDIKEMKANDETPVPSNGNSLYAIEANIHWFKNHNIKIGDEVYITNKTTI
jgi:hypothetical protein